jgi:hypothetical protein
VTLTALVDWQSLAAAQEIYSKTKREVDSASSFSFILFQSVLFPYLLAFIPYFLLSFWL